MPRSSSDSLAIHVRQYRLGIDELYQCTLETKPLNMSQFVIKSTVYDGNMQGYIPRYIRILYETQELLKHAPHKLTSAVTLNCANMYSLQNVTNTEYMNLEKKGTIAWCNAKVASSVRLTCQRVPLGRWCQVFQTRPSASPPRARAARRSILHRRPSCP